MLEAPTRDLIRRRIDQARRRDLGAELDDDGRTDLRDRSGQAGLAVASWEAAKGDPLYALVLALDELDRRTATA